MTEPTHPPPSPPGAAPGRSRQAVGLWVGAGLGILVVGIVLLVTLRSGSGDATIPLAAPPHRPVATTVSLPPELLAPIDVPEGDYAGFCTELLTQTDSFSSQSGIEQLRTLFQELDFERLIPLAPEGLRPSLTILRDSQTEAQVALDQIESVTDLQSGDFPEGFLTAFAQVGRAYGEKCVTPTATGTTGT